MELKQYIDTASEYISDLYEKVDPYIKQLCLPAKNPSSLRGRREAFTNYLNFYALPSFLLGQLIAFLFMSGFTLKLFLAFGLINLLMIGVFLGTCRDFPIIYKIVNSVLLMATGPIALFISDKNILFSMASAAITPAFIFLLSQNHNIALGGLGLKFVLLNLIYMPSYRTQILSLGRESLEAFVDDQFDVINQVILLNGSLAVLLYFILRSSFSETQATSKKNEQDISVQERFLLRFSHELRNPLNSVLGNLEMAYLENADPRVGELLSNAKVCGELLLQLINNILDSGKMELEGLEVNYKPTNVHEVLEKIWAISSEMIKKKGLFGRMTIHKKVPQFLMLDSYRIIQIMLNLVRNAVRFTDKGNVRISVSWIENDNITNETFEPLPFGPDEGVFEKNRGVEALMRSSSKNDVYNDPNSPFHVLDFVTKKIVLQPNNSNDINMRFRRPQRGILKIIVSDTGCGMNEERVKKVFTKFPEINRPAGSNNLVGTGNQRGRVTGLSMYITRQICEKMNAEIRAFSKVNVGTTFIVCVKAQIPTQEQNNDISMPTSNLPTLSNGKSAGNMRGLVVDDNPYNSELNKRYLEKNAVTVVGCSKNGMEALDIYKHEVQQGRPIHIVTVDLDMPLFDGRAACERIREYEAQRNLTPSTIIIISGNCFEADIKECLDPNGKVKANHFIRKPIYYTDFQRLIQTIQANYSDDSAEPFAPKKVLIVDDDTFNRQILGKLLTKNNFEYLEAKNGQQAVEVYQKNWKEIGLIFMDCEMPVLDGYGATKAIRALQAQKKLPKIKIYGLTGHVGPESENKCKDAGMDSTVTKPFRMENLTVIVADCFRAYR